MGRILREVGKWRSGKSRHDEDEVRYTSSMAVDSSRTTKIEEGEEKECLRIDFTNGALQQLEDLKGFIGTDDPVEVVRAAISLMQRIKDANSESIATKE